MKFKDLLPILTGINRIRLEFKVIKCTYLHNAHIGINRIRLEFKASRPEFSEDIKKGY